MAGKEFVWWAIRDAINPNISFEMFRLGVMGDVESGVYGMRMCARLLRFGARMKGMEVIY